MKFWTAFSCGDKAWVFDGLQSVQYTVGQIQLKYTKSETVDNPVGPVLSYTGGRGTPCNYQAQEGYEEWYMCNETGIGSGSNYQLGLHIFKTKEECDAAHAAWIEKNRLEAEARVRRYREEKLGREASLLAELEEIKALKMEAEQS